VSILRVVLPFGFWLCGYAGAAAGQIILPSDVSVALTAEPNVNLQSGQ